MPVQILCLHGMGVNSEVFRAQSASFRVFLPSSYDFKFVDSDLICDPSPGAAEFYTGPYRCWYNTPSQEKVKRAHKQVFALMSKEGRFDMIMGFSQGAALAASMILHHQTDHPTDPPLFRAAIFICSPLPFSRSLEHGIDVRTYFGLQVTQLLNPGRPTTVPEYLIPAQYFLQRDEPNDSENTSKSKSKSNGVARQKSTPGSSSSLAAGFVPSTSSEEPGKKGPFYNMFHASVDKARIAIPTAHIYGRQDSWRPHSLDLVALCERPVVFEHDGGHEVPISASEQICDVIEEVVAMAGLTV